MKLINGRMFNWGMRELIVGESISKRFMNTQLGSFVKIAGDYWRIVGIFSTDGSGFDSEIWGDGLQLDNAFKRGTTVSTITLKLDNAQNFADFKSIFESDRRLQQFEPQIEQNYFEDQSRVMATFIRVLGIFVTIIFSFGATIGATITMYAAVSNRTVEIGTLRSIRFQQEKHSLGIFN